MSLRRWMADLPIGHKLTLLATTASAIALGVSSVAFVAYDRATFDESTIRRLSGEAAIIAATSAAAMVFRAPEAAQATLQALAGEKDVTAAALYTMDGAPFATYTARPGVEMPLAPSPTFVGHAFQDGHLLVHQRVVFEGAPVGTLVIRDELTARWERLRRYLITVSAVSLAALLVALLAGRLAGRAISGPILALAGTARAVSERNDFSARVLPRGRDEVGVLMTTFNEMLDGLERRDADLRRVQAELEERVKERTELLREAEDANRLKDQFLATLSHELRTPLNAIVGWTTLLMQGNLAPDAAERAVTVIDRNARAQTKLIDDVLDVSRIVSGKLRLHARALDLATVAPFLGDLPLVGSANIALAAGDRERALHFYRRLPAVASWSTPPALSLHLLALRVQAAVALDALTDLPNRLPPTGRHARSLSALDELRRADRLRR